MIGSKGFSILEVLFGITVFMVGMLGIAALQISSVQGNYFSSNLTEATFLATSKFEELMDLPYDDPDDPDDPLDDRNGDSAGQDNNAAGPDGVDDDDDDDDGNPDGISGPDDVINFGLDATDYTSPGVALFVDHSENPPRRGGMYVVSWNVAVDHPLPNCKTVKVWVEWTIKGDRKERISMAMVKEEVK
ncbi:MAG: hypothetical protein KKE17_06115 [Proteobacteria bacterium]|nr:hypothetical protein [Pseudomonadota bacterium]MBU1709562.1 hypothetical protein [Pseudomonadota bacterium]